MADLLAREKYLLKTRNYSLKPTATQSVSVLKPLIFYTILNFLKGNLSTGQNDSGRETGTSTSSRLAMDSGKKWIQLVSAESSPETGFVSDQSHKSQKKQQTTKLMGPYNQLYSRPSLISRNALLSTTVNVSNF